MAAFIIASASPSRLSLATKAGATTPSRLCFPTKFGATTSSSHLSLRGRRASASAAADFRSAGSCSLKTRLGAGETLHGLCLLSLSPTLAELAAIAGYDYVLVDLEHGQGGIQEALACVRALDATATPALIRIPAACDVWAKKALDLGPAGIMIPNVESAAVAQAAVSYCRYPPMGVRGAACAVIRASAYGVDNTYLSRCEQDMLIILQVETASGIAEIDAIAAVDGVDVINMGPHDLAASLGLLQDPHHWRVREMLREAERKLLKTPGRPYLGGFAMPTDPPQELKVRGYSMVTGAKDISLFRNAALDQVKRFKQVGDD